MSNLYWIHGKFCANHPWEVIMSTAILIAFLMSVETSSRPLRVLSLGHEPTSDSFAADDTVVLSAVRFISVVYCCYQIGKMHKMDSKYVAFIACLFTVFSSFIFSTSVLNFLGSELSDFKDALLIFLLVIDLNKAILLAQVALSSTSQEEVKHNIANGISLLGPSLGFDTLVEILLISIGTLCGVKRLEILCCFACLSAIVNYLVIMTFYPACLTILAELNKVSLHVSESNSLILQSLKEQCEAPNPVVQRVKVVMSAALVIVHIQSRYDAADTDEVIDFKFDMNSAKEYLMSIKSYMFIKYAVVGFVMWCTFKLMFRNELVTAVNKFFHNFNQLPERRMDSQVLSMESRPQVKVITSSTQTPHLDGRKESTTEDEENSERPSEENEPRSTEECLAIYKGTGKVDSLTDSEVYSLVKEGLLSVYQLDKAFGDLERAVNMRRMVLGADPDLAEGLITVPYRHYDYGKVVGVCCENVVGYIPVPVGVAGPLRLDGKTIYVPMATTEGCLVASTNRGCKALRNGVRSKVVGDGMSRGPVVRFESVADSSTAAAWLEVPTNFEIIKSKFDSTSQFARLKKIKCRVVGRLLYLRFVASTGDAMGMNMLSKGTESALLYLQQHFPHMQIVSLSGNFCCDKKPSAINWIEGRGKSVVCEAVVPAKTVAEVLKTTVAALIDLNTTKNLIGSAVAGSIGGFNAHASNIVTAVYIATGQDPAQNVVSSNCITLMEPWGEDGQDLYISCTMPSLEVGTVGGGTQLPAQSGCLGVLGVRGGSRENPGENACNLARVVCATVLAGELSLMAALAAGHLVNSHLTLNRSNRSHNIL